MKRLLVLVPLLLSPACAVVKASHLRDDWTKGDQQLLRRVAVVVQPLPAGNQKAGETFARIARRYVNMKRDFLVKQEVVQAEPVKPEAICGTDEHIEGILFLHVTMTGNGGGFETELKAALARCPDLREAWTAEAAGSFPSKDEGLKEITGVYVRELGADAEAYVAPAMNVLRPALDTLPQPLLNEDDRTEKMSLD